MSDKTGKMEFASNSPEDTRVLGEAIGQGCRGGEVILLRGQLGAGKTTFVQGLARGLGIRGAVKSPSFVLEKIHRGRLVLRHLDLYRLGAREVEEAGLLEEMREGEVTVVEWADRANDTIKATLEVEIKVHDCEPSRRTIFVETELQEWESFLRGVKIGE